MLSRLNQFFIGQLYTPEHNELLRQHHELIGSIIPSCVTAFYQVLLSDAATKRFLTSELVENHLTQELKVWLTETLSEKPSESECLASIHKQRQVGEIHARIDVPMALVNSAMLIIKQVLFEQIRDHQSINAEAKMNLVIVLDQLLDASLSLINESYLEGRVENERSAQEYRSRSSAHEIAIEIERVKGALYGWMTQFMADLLTSNRRVVDIHHQEFALWIRHKLSFVSPNDKIVRKIKLNLDSLQLELDRLAQAIHENKDESIQKITALANECGWLLGQVADQNLEASAREDSLTSLIERRFLAPIMQNETQMAMKTQSPYSVMMIDVDNFKSVNDIHGHQAGDAVLSSIGHILKRSLRVTDYAFRYGGEEFLILMPETPASNAIRAADKLLDKVRNASITLDNGRHLKVSVSIGIAQFDKHPDFEQVIKHADEKLYEAKHNGKDRYEI